MGSVVPIELAEEDEEFDWEAAVKEIDLACLKTSIAFSSSSSHFTLCANPPITKPPAKRQSTLDKLIGRTERNKPTPPENQVVSDPHFDEFECGDDKSSCVGIDPETANTWIYPVNVNVPLRDYQFAITNTALFSALISYHSLSHPSERSEDITGHYFFKFQRN